MNSVRLRLVSTSLAAVLTVAAVYMAFTQKFTVISDFFVDPAPIVVVEEQKTPVVPPPKMAPPPPQPKLETRSTPDIPNAEPVFTYIPEAAPSEPAVIVNPQWLERPSGRDFARYYPERAIARERAGRVVLDCIVAANGRIGCTVASEEPAGWGFGAAALRIAESFRMSPRLENGQATEGGRVRVPINFRLE